MASNSNNFPAGDNDYVIIIVIPVVGCFLFVIASLALCFYMKKRNNKKRSVQEIDLKHIDEHMRIQEAIVTDSHGRKKTVVLSVKGDVHVDEDIIKREKEFNVGTSEVGSGDLEAGQHSSSGDVAKLEKS
nr:proline-rich receptor-like protein kinase PERK2 [Ipomoea batatas]